MRVHDKLSQNAADGRITVKGPGKNVRFVGK
jgi:hypothetical protein